MSDSSESVTEMVEAVDEEPTITRDRTTRLTMSELVTLLSIAHDECDTLLDSKVLVERLYGDSVGEDVHKEAIRELEYHGYIDLHDDYGDNRLGVTWVELTEVGRDVVAEHVDVVLALTKSIREED